jgi:hypothetical protein
MTNATPKRIAAAILARDIDIVTDYWRERHEYIRDNEIAAEITDQMDKILSPFLERLERIRGDVTIGQLEKGNQSC